MIRKLYVVNILLFLALIYIMVPRVLEKTLFLNELLALAGALLLIRKRFMVQRFPIIIWFSLLLLLCLLHAVVSLFRMDGLYYYLRNMVIFYSMFSFFIGFWFYKYLKQFIAKIKIFLTAYIAVFLFYRNESFFDRFGVTALFPALLTGLNNRFAPYLLVLLNIIYAITYTSSTAFMIAMFLLLVLVSRKYRFFRAIVITGLSALAVFFIYIHPYVAVIYTYSDQSSMTLIGTVKATHPLLAQDPNNTWRLIMWDQLIVDHFPANLAGIGFGTPALRFFPVEDYTKLSTLPYVVGGHNSFIYLFCRLGVLFLVIIAMIYHLVFKEYFENRSRYRQSGDDLIFLSFFSVTVVAFFNPVLETPIFAGTYWLLLGFVTQAIYNKRPYSFLFKPTT